jgi:hypothetical protein
MSSHVIDETAWARMTVFEQMGNIGSEVGRAIAAKKRGKQKWMKSAFYRGVDLFNITASQWAQKRSPRLKELLYAREQFASFIVDDKEDPTLEKYFFQFALAARKDR